MKKSDQQGSPANDTDIFRLRKNTKLNEALFLSKIILKKHGSVQIQGMGQCISLVTKLSQILSKNGFALIKNLQSQNVERDGNRSINPKLSVKMEKSAEFDNLTKDIVVK